MVFGKGLDKNSENNTNSDLDTRAFNSSLRLQVSDFDQEDIADQ